MSDLNKVFIDQNGRISIDGTTIEKPVSYQITTETDKESGKQYIKMRLDFYANVSIDLRDDLTLHKEY